MFDLSDKAGVDNPFFIMGCGRSGTSLLARILNNHPRIAVPAESHLFNIFYPWLKYYGDLTKGSNQARLVDDMLSTFHIRHWIPPLEREHVLDSIREGTFGGIVDAVLRSWASSQGKSRYGEKTPQHLFYWREILHAFPDAKIVHIVRDGRDVALSFIRSRFGPKTVYMAARRWARELEQIGNLREELPNQQFCELRYENLLDDPERTLSDVCAFLGERYDPELLQFQYRRRSIWHDRINKEKLQNSILKENQKKWLEQMSPREIRLFESVAQPLLIKYGYESGLKEQPKLSKVERIYHQIAGITLKLFSMATHRDGQSYELARFKIWLRLQLLEKLQAYLLFLLTIPTVDLIETF